MNSYEYNNCLGSQYWVNSYNKSFSTIQQESYLPQHFRQEYVTNNILKPINMYAYYYSPKPIIKHFDNILVLTQNTHAEIWVEPKGNNLYALDKTWQRQFYPSSETFDVDENCFLAKYKFYTPWIINYNFSVDIQTSENSPFVIKTKTVDFFKNNNNPQWISFIIKKNGSHMKNNEYGIIDINTPAYDIIIKDMEIANKILDEYEK